MSSELRVKKLRGSGGYAIAALTDEQQSKASIGGPDLFLAPLCRIDPDSISKYMCNMCDKEYEGSPKIQYENPNEDVAPGLTLIEKGRYLCNTCGTTIAEYREFRKDEEGQQQQQEAETAAEPPAVHPQSEPVAEQAVAQAAEPSAQTEPTAVATAPTEDTQAAEPSAQTEPTAVATEQPTMTATATAATSPSDATESPPSTESAETAEASVSPMEGRPVYDENASKIGTVKQIGLDRSTNSMAMVVTQNDGAESIIPWSRIRKVGEAVLLGEAATTTTTAQAQSPGAAPQSAGGCGSCGFANREGSKFCEECGTRL